MYFIMQNSRNLKEAFDLFHHNVLHKILSMEIFITSR